MCFWHGCRFVLQNASRLVPSVTLDVVDKYVHLLLLWMWQSSDLSLNIGKPSMMGAGFCELSITNAVGLAM